MVNGTLYANVFKCKSSYVLLCGKNDSETENKTNILKIKTSAIKKNRQL